MRLDISELLKKKISEIHFDQTFTMDILEREEFVIKLKSPIIIKGRVVNEGDIVEVNGNFSVSIEVECSRCLEEFEHLIHVDFEEYFSKSINEHDDYYQILDGDLILDEMVMDNIILSMPVRFICNEECKGLCHTCGVNLNKVDCDCEMGTVNPKFAALKDLFKQNEEV